MRNRLDHAMVDRKGRTDEILAITCHCRRRNLDARADRIDFGQLLLDDIQWIAEVGIVIFK